MSTNFPTSIDSLTNPEAGSALNSPSHSDQHINSNDAIEALEAKVGVDSSAVTTSHDYKISQLESGKQDALGFTPEDVVNKRTSFQATPTDTAYPSEKLVKDSLDGKVDKTTFDANTILKATNDNTPVSLTVGEQTVVGRVAGGEISALAIDSDLSSVSANNDTIPSAKATKSYADSKVEDSITDGHTDIAPSGNAVFDALALKAPVKSTGSTSDASSITPTGNYPENEYYVTALAQALTINAPSGTAVNGNTLLFRIKDNGTARALTWNAAYTFIGTTKPDTTVAGKIIYIGAIYNSTATKWEAVSINQEA